MESPSVRGRGRGRGPDQGAQRAPICRHFERGACSRGSRCTFSHDLGGAAPTSSPRGRGGASGPRAGEAPGRPSHRPDDPYGAFQRWRRREQLASDGEYREFLGAAIACLSDPDMPPESVDTVLQQLCGTWKPPPPPPGAGAAANGGLLLGGAADGGGVRQNDNHAHKHLERLMSDLRKRSAEGKLTIEVFVGRAVPLLRLLSCEAVRGSLKSHWVNPLYDTVLHGVDFGALADLYGTLLSGTQPSTALFLQQQQQAATMAGGAGGARPQQWRWMPATWLDLVEPPAVLLNELLERFQRPEQRDLLAPASPAAARQGQQQAAAAAAAGPAERLADALQGLYDKHVAAAGTAAAGQAARARRFREVLRSVREQLRHGQSRRQVLDDAQAAQRRQADAAREAAGRGDRAAAQRLADPRNLPGELRPGGPRHDNDHAHFAQIQVVPTCQELLCATEPYLPSNRAGSMPHLGAELHRARLEVNFRLLRHDVVAPLASALVQLQASGGLSRLWAAAAAQQQRQQRVGKGVQAAADRLRLEGGNTLFVFRHARFEGFAMDKTNSMLRVSFEQPASAARAGPRRAVEDWWKRSKRLGHGTLCCFWWEPQAAAAAAAAASAAAAAAASAVAGGGGSGGAAEPGGRGAAPAVEPRLVVGVVAQREPKDLAGVREASDRPVIGIRLVNARDHEALLGAWLEAGGGGGSEVVLVQEHNSFFAYEPVLRALQATTTIPLAQHIVPGAAAPAAASTAPQPAATSAFFGFTAPPTASAASPAAAAAPELPAYLADAPLVDLRHVVDRARVMALPLHERARVLRALSAVDLSGGGTAALEALLAATTLDAAQARALLGALSREVAVVQGPPGTGKTYLGVVLTKALLRNTRGDAASAGGGGRRGNLLLRDDDDEGGSALPAWIAEDVGFDAAQPPVRPAGALAAPAPLIGPLLVVCFTNHALDSFLEGLLDAHVTHSIVRVGSNTKSERLEAFNLRNLQDRAGGYRVKQLHTRADELSAKARSLGERLKHGHESRPLTWSQLGPLLHDRHPRLYASFRAGRRPWNRQPREQQDAAGDGGGAAGGLIQDGDVYGGAYGNGGPGGGGDGDEWVAVGRRGKKSRASRYRDLVRDDWLQGAPDSDWRLARVRTAAELAAAGGAAAAAEDGMIASDDDDDEQLGAEDGYEYEHDSGVQEEEEEEEWYGGGMTGQQQPVGRGGAAAVQMNQFWAQLQRMQQGPAAAAAPGTRGAGGGGNEAPAAAPAPPGAGAAAGPAAAPTPAQMAAQAALERLQHRAAAEAAELQAAAAAAAAAPARPAGARGAAAAAAAAGGGAGGEEEELEEGEIRVDDDDDELLTEMVERHYRNREQQQQQQQQGARGARGAAQHGAPHGRRRGAPDAAAPVAPVPEEIVAMGRRQRALPELIESGDVWAMSRHERWLLHSALQRLRHLDTLEAVAAVQEQYAEVQKQLQAEYDQAALATLRSARVVGMTTSGVARMQQLVAAIKPRVVLVEEAAEVFEAHVLVCMSRCTEHLVLIGDHEQLRPKPNVYELQAESRKGLDLDVSLFERLVRQTGFTVHTLEEQRRMRPTISRLIREAIYPALRDHPSVREYPPLRGLSHSLFFVDHDHPEGGGGEAEDRSKCNEWEAAYVVALARHMLLQGYKPSDVVILVAYAGQLHKVRAALSAVNLRVVVSERDREQLDRAGLADGDEDGDGSTADSEEGAAGGAAAAAAGPSSSAATAAGSGRAAGARAVRGGDGGGSIAAAMLAPGDKVVAMRESIRVATVDNYQGEEATVILLSTVRNNKEGHIGFLRMRNRANVMLSRAKHGMVVLGNAATLRAGARRSGVDMWERVLDMVQQDGCMGPCCKVKCVNHGVITEVPEPADFERLVGDGGCQQPCGEAMPCGHTCPRRCHADDRAHSLVVCTRPCTRLHAACGHACSRTCGEPCGRCTKRLEEPFRLECGHMSAAGIECWRRREPGAVRCEVPVDVPLPACGHVLRVPCYQAEDVRAGRRGCSETVQLTMPACGHTITVPCHERAAVLANPTRCTATCGALLTCEHACGGKCGQCVQGVLRAKYDDLVDGFIASQSAGLRGAWSRRNPGGSPSVNGFLAFVSDPTGPGAAFLTPFLAHLRASMSAQGAAAAGAAAGAAAAAARQGHAACTAHCTRNLVCGHECGSRCHGRNPCGACKKRCWIGCAHHACRKACSEPCIPCAETCVWRCEHQGACCAPCGAPCDRLPCDRRCSRTLACGHRCPGLCGEPCPPAKLCVHPACMATASEGTKNLCVDLIEMRSFSDLTEADVDSDPLLALPCGHALLMSNLDAHVGLSQLYASAQQDAAGGSSGGGGSSSSSSSSSSGGGSGRRWLHPLPLQAEGGGGGSQPCACPLCREPIRGVRRYGRATNAAALDLIQRKHMQKWGGVLAGAQQALRQLAAHVDAAEGTPQRGLAVQLAAAAAHGRQAGLSPAGALMGPVAWVQQQAETIMRRLNEVCDEYLNPPKQRVYEAALVQLQRFEETAAGGEEGEAAAGASGGTGAQATAAAARAGRLKVARQDLASLRTDTSQLCQAFKGILEAVRVHVATCAAGVASAGRLLQDLAGAAAAVDRGIPGRGRGGRPAAAMWIRELRVQIAHLLQGGLLVADSFLLERAPQWRDTAVAGRNWNSAFALSEAALRLGAARLGLLRVVMALPQAAAVELTYDDLRAMQEATVLQMRDEGDLALRLYRGESGFEQQGYENVHVTSIEGMLQELDRLAGEVDMADVLAALSAVAAKEAWGGADALSWLQGHLYTCPNGHVYTIGDCGGAMQTSRCLECNAIIGGGGHRLASGNAQAAEVLQRLRAMSAAR